MRPLSLSALTILELSPPDMVSCAAAAGYSHVGIRLVPATPEEPEYPVIGDTPMVREVLARMANTGVRVFDIEILRLKPETDVRDYLPVLETGARLGAGFALVAGNDPDEARLIQNFGALCDLCAPLGIRPHLEPMPWTDVRNVAQANRVVAQVGHPAAGMLVDAFHFDRSDSRLEDVAEIPGERVGYAQLCDAPQPRPATMEAVIQQARSERLFPGEGGIDLAGLLRALPPGTPLGIEVPRNAMAKTVDAVTRARMALAATRQLLASLGEAV